MDHQEAKAVLRAGLHEDVLKMATSRREHSLDIWPLGVRILMDKDGKINYEVDDRSNGSNYWMVSVKPEADECCVHRRVMCELYCAGTITTEVLQEWLGAGRCC